MYIVFTSFNLFSSSIKLKYHVFMFFRPPDIKRNLIYYAPGVPPPPHQPYQFPGRVKNIYAINWTHDHDNSSYRCGFDCIM